MINVPNGAIESASRDEVLSALVMFAEPLDVRRLKEIQAAGCSATKAEKSAAAAILLCIDAVKKQVGLSLPSVLNRIYVYSHVPDPVREIYTNAYSLDAAHPTFPIQPADVYGCRAILDAMQLANTRL